MSTTAASLVEAHTASPIPPRSAAIDRLRGAAVALMVLDHLLIVTGHSGSVLRETVTRAALPLFCILAGHLAGRASWRWGALFVAGAVLPAVVPWVDAPNVLLLIFCGLLYLAAVRLMPPALGDFALLFAVVLGLTRFANGYADPLGDRAFDYYAVVGLMALGRLIPRLSLERVGSVLPASSAAFGRYPLSLYVGHLLFLHWFVLLGVFGA